MDMSSFTSYWNELSSQYQHYPTLMTDDYQLQNFSGYSQLSDHHMSYSIPKPVNCLERPRKVPKEMIGWSACAPGELQVPLVPKEEAWMGFLNSDVSFNRMYDQVNHNHGMRPAVGSTRPAYARGEDHIITERKRREKLSQRFISLAAIIPGLKKADKASILGDAIKYVKELEHNLKSLQDLNRKKTVESAVILANKSKLCENEEHLEESSGSVNSDGSPDGSEVQVKLSEKTVLVKIHCKNHKGLLVNLLSEIEKLKLEVTNTNAVPFVGAFVDITITAQTEEGFSMTAKELAREIGSIFPQYNCSQPSATLTRLHGF